MSITTNMPPEIAVKLDQSLRRVRSILFFRGVSVVFFVTLAAVLLHMAVLAMLGDEFSTVAGWSLWSLSLIAVGITAWFSLLKPMRRKFTAAEIASLIERNHPELEERLSTVVELAALDELEASSSLLAEITRAAVLDAGRVSPKREFTQRTVRPRLLAAVIAGLILAALFTLSPSQTGRLFVKALNPSSTIGNIYSASMDITPKGDRTVESGKDFVITLRERSGGSAKAYVIVDDGAGGEYKERMTFVSSIDGVETYSYTFPAVEQGFSYRVKRGRAVSDFYRISVVEPPDFSARRIEILHPAYTKRPADVNLKDGTIVGLVGSTVRVTVTPSRSGLTGELELPDDQHVPATVTEDGKFLFEFKLEKGLMGKWGVHVKDANGFENLCEMASITTVTDDPPEIRLTSPEVLEVTLPRTGELPLGWEITEDFGLARTVLEMCRGAGTWEEVGELDSFKTGGVTWSGNKLEPFFNKDFGDAGVVRFRIKAVDCLPEELGGPGTNCTQEVMVTLSTGTARNAASSLASQSLKAEIDAGKKKTDSILQFLRWSESNIRESRNCYARYAKNKKDGWAAQVARGKLAESKANLANAERMVNELIDDLEASRLQSGADMYRPLLDNPFGPARQKIDDIFTIAHEEDKAVACGEAAVLIHTCLEAFEATKKRFDALSKKAIDLQALEEYAERERQLAELAAKDEISARTLAEQEEILKNQFEQQFKDELNKNLNWQKDVAKRLAERTEKLAARQAQLKEKAAAATTEEERKTIASEEKKLSGDARQLARETGDLKNHVENVVGPYQDDPARTAEPIKDAAGKEWQAANAANAAAEKAAQGDLQGAQEEMNAVEQTLTEAKAQLAEAQARIGGANQELAENAEDFRAMANALHEAVQAAQEAAREQSGQQQQGGEQQQSGEQQQGQQQQGGEQQQSGEQQQGQQQQGGEQQESGEQQQGQQQQSGEQQPGEQQPGEQQSGEQQQGPQQGGEQQPSPARQAAQQKAMDAAQKMQAKAEQKAEQGNLPLDQFQQNARQQGGQQQKGQKPGDQQTPQQQTPQQQNEQGEPSDQQGPHQDTPSPVGEEGGLDAVDASEDWFKMKGDVKAEAEVEKADDVPEEYRDLVTDYFKAIKSKGGRRR